MTRYRDAVRESREIELKITQLRLRYAAPSAINYSDMPKAHNNSDLSDYMTKLEELTEQLYARYEKCLGIMIDIEMRLDQMEGPNAQLEREILRHRYTDITDQGHLSSWEDSGTRARIRAAAFPGHVNVGIECPFYMCENGSVRSLDIPFFDNTLMPGRRTLTGTALFC